LLSWLLAIAALLALIHCLTAMFSRVVSDCGPDASADAVAFWSFLAFIILAALAFIL
jgi:hypothetical protein